MPRHAAILILLIFLLFPSQQCLSETSHAQVIIQQKSSQRTVTRSHAADIETSAQDQDIDAILERYDLKLTDAAMPYGGPDAINGWPEPAQGYQRQLWRAWRLYTQGDYPAAAKIFASLQSETRHQTSSKATLGLAYTHLKQGHYSQARELLEGLIHQGFKTSEILPVLLALLMDAGRYERVHQLIPQLAPARRTVWQRRVLEAELTDHFKNMSDQADASALLHFLERHQAARAQCIRPDLFFTIARRLHQLGQDSTSLELNRQLLACKTTYELRYGVLSLMTDLMPAEAALTLVRRDQGAYAGRAPGYTQKLAQLELMLLKRQLAVLTPNTAAHRATVRAILALVPDDADALAALAWSKYRAKDYHGAAALFSRLLAQAPGNRSYALGLGYCRLNLGQIDSALTPLDDANQADNRDTLALRRSVYLRQAAKAYEDQDWDRAAIYLGKVLAIDPDDADTQQFLAWTYHHQGKTTQARALMEQAHTGRATPDTAAGLLDLYSHLREEKPAQALANKLIQDSDPQIRRVGADYYFANQAPITASQASNDPETCYFNAASSRIETFFYHTYKDGDSGFSQMEQTALPMTMVVPTRVGRQWSLSLTPKYLSSGNAPDQPFAGRYYNLLNGTAQRNGLEENLWVWAPDIGLELEHQWGSSLAMHAGTTPMNGAVSPTPTFRFALNTSQWHLDLHRCAVQDSILAYTGAKDPYSASKWGRVTRNGLSMGHHHALGTDYWFTSAIGYNLYDGDNTWDNHSWHIDLALGRTLMRNSDEISYGLFASAKHYRRNSDFFTFGHGGYYSPQLATMIGPLFRYRSAPCRTYWFDVQAAMGWLHQELDDSPYYPLEHPDPTALIPAAQSNLQGRYTSDIENRLGYALKLQGMKQFNPYLAAGAFINFSHNADDISWQLGLGIQYFFSPQNLFWTRYDLVNQFTPCTNK